MLIGRTVLLTAIVGISATAVSVISGCGGSGGDTSEAVDLTKLKNPYPAISADTAFSYIQKQLSFGYRIPGTQEHLNCANWLYSRLLATCDTVYFQKGSAKTTTGKTIPVYNLVGSFKPGSKQRMILASHWDSRPWGDNDTKDQDKPIEAANDGASGVAVLLDLARVLKNQPPPVGVDIIFFDAEDLGKPGFENSFCLGSQYWAANPHTPGYKAQFGVLLDMVGGKDAQFFQEAYSLNNAAWVLSHVWGLASELGYGAQFVNTPIGAIEDDHYHVTKGTRIPMIDIIQHDPEKGSFAPYWHTHSDNIDAVDKATLGKVGTLMSALVFNPPFDSILP